MGTRGPKSSASQELIPADSPDIVKRPDPPPDLTDEQAAEWQAIVDRLPSDWFPAETLGLLAQYCRHVVTSRRVAQLIQRAEASDDFDIETYDRLLKMQEREGRAMSSLATRMRISQQSAYDKTRKKPIEGNKPWEEEE